MTDKPTLAEKQANYRDAGFHLDCKFDFYPTLTKEEYTIIRELIAKLAEKPAVAHLFKPDSSEIYLYRYLKMINVAQAIQEIQLDQPDLYPASLHEKVAAIAEFENHKDWNINEGAETREIHASDVSDSKPGEYWVYFYIKFPYSR